MDQRKDNRPPEGSAPPGPGDQGSTIAMPGSLTTLRQEDIEKLWGEELTFQFDDGATLKARLAGPGRWADLTVKEHSLAQPDQEPQLTDDFHLLKVIGEGGIGVVYEARQMAIDRIIAIKMLKADHSAEPGRRAKFIAEAVVTGDLDHPNIVPIHDLGVNESGQLFYAMKMVRGTPWSRAIGTMPQNENVQILMRVADAVAFAHSKGVIHRDLKPDNVMLGEFGEVVVMDWGLAVSVSPEGKADKLSQSLAFGGTPAYMAPEMALGQVDKIGFASDVYLLGAMLYEILTGRKPHKGRNVTESITLAANNAMLDVAGQPGGELMDIAMKALSTRPQDRFDSVKEFQSEIRYYEAHAESVDLAESAQDDMKAAAENKDYPLFARGMYRFQEALNVWPDNINAKLGLSAIRQAYALCALEKGDLDLAGQHLDPADPAHAELLVRVAKARKERDQMEAAIARERKLAERQARRALNVNKFLMEMLSSSDPARRGRSVTVLEVMSQMASELDRRFSDDHETLASVHQTLGVTYRSLGQYDLADTHLESAGKLLADIAGEDSLEYAQWQGEWASLKRLEGKYEQAEELFREVLETHRRLLGVDHPETLRTINSLSQAMFDQGKYDQAEKLIRAVLDVRRRMFNSEHPDTLESMSQLAVLLRNAGRIEEAEDQYRIVLDARRRVRGPKHLDTLSTMHSLACVLFDRGKLPEARRQFQEVLDHYKVLMGEEHPDTLNTMHCLAVILCQEEMLEQAESLNRTVLDIRRRVLGRDHPETLNSMNSLAVSLVRQCKFVEGIELLTEVAEHYKNSLGPEHPNTLLVTNNLANFYDWNGDFDRAREITEQVIEIRLRTLGPEHPDSLTSKHFMGNILVELGKLDEAIRMLRETMACRQRVMGETAGPTLAAMLSLAVALHKTGKFDEARELCRKVIEARSSQSPPDNQNCAEALLRLAEVELAAGNNADAAKAVQEAGKLTLPDKCWQAALLTAVQAQCAQAAGDFAGAFSMASAATAAMAAARGPRHPSTRAARLVLLKIAETWKAKDPSVFRSALEKDARAAENLEMAKKGGRAAQRLDLET
ncbi:MAG: tetratricopeptide repeat protein [Planctomycetes bacterium]|nr:tetratricopeptide repeat protein [Planctomycetota bacterium]